MPGDARHAAGLVLAERGYRTIGGGPVTWHAARGRLARPAGGWSGYFVLDGAPEAIFDLTEWIDRSAQLPVIRYAYQVRYCSGLRSGLPWLYRLDLHPLESDGMPVPHVHDHQTPADEHDPRPSGVALRLSGALPLLEQHLFSRIGGCAHEAPAIRGRAPCEPRT